MKLNEPLNLADVKELSIDTETYGLMYNDKIFSAQIALPNGGAFYYNLKKYEDAPWVPIISDEDFISLLEPLKFFKGTVYMANATYDLQKLALHGIHLNEEARIHCTHTFERFFKPDETPKLDTYAPKYGHKKLDIATEYINKHNLFDPKKDFMGVTIPKKKRFDLIPWSVISEYGMVDAEITLSIGQKQTKKAFNKDLANTTTELTRALHNIEMFGVKLDHAYCTQQFLKHKDICFNILNEQEEGFKDGKIYLKKLYKDEGLTVLYNKKTKEPIFNNEELEQYKHIPRVAALLKYREHYKLYRSFYFNLIYYSSNSSRLHVNLNPYGTKTSRFSSTKPALQTLPSDNKEVKRALIPDEGTFFLELDYSGMEMRLAFDLAAEHTAIKAMNNGLDVHLETSKKVGSTRRQAKTTNFAKLYGSGIKRIASQTGLSYAEAKRIYLAIDKAQPKVKVLNDKLKKQASITGHIKNVYGRVLHIPSDKTYKALNYYIQSAGADTMRRAIVSIDKYINAKKLGSRMVLSVHDSLLIQIPKEEKEHQKKFIELMTAAYSPLNGLPMVVDAGHSLSNYADMSHGIY